MDGLQLYFDVSSGLYRYTDEAEEDSGVEDIPFSFYSTDLYTSPEILTQTSTCNDADDEDLTYVDDVRDCDYMPHKSSYVSKKGKRPYKRRQYNGNTCLSQLMTPEKERHKLYGVGGFDVENHVRHYARKDRTPDTIQKMMERHRESERVRHHTLNESMKDVCLRVPGYDPDVKETKVIQMQRIIAYECFLENTLTSVCEKVGANPKSLKMSTNFITDAMKSTPIEEFYQPSNYKTSDVEEEEDGVVIKTEVMDDGFLSHSGYKVSRKQSNNRHLHKYRQEKISSPTIDSTTNDFIQVMPVSPTATMPGYQYMSNGCFPAQCFIPIDSTSQHLQSSQESGIKMEETQSTCYDDDNHFHEDIGTFMDHGICAEPEHLKTVTPSFMKEEVNSTSSSYNDTDQYQAFDLSSPIRHHEKVFLQSPKSTGVWSRQKRPYFLGKADTPMGKEMQYVSPENVLETKSKLLDKENQPSGQHIPEAMPTSMSARGTDMMQMTASQIIQATQNSNELQHMYDPQGRQFSTYKVFSGISQENGCIKIQHIYIPKFENGTLKLDCSDSSGKNKRKRYTPLRTMDDTSNVYAESDDEECDGMSSLCGETTDTDIEDHGIHKQSNLSTAATL